MRIKLKWFMEIKVIKVNLAQKMQISLLKTYL